MLADRRRRGATVVVELPSQLEVVLHRDRALLEARPGRWRRHHHWHVDFKLAPAASRRGGNATGIMIQ